MTTVPIRLKQVLHQAGEPLHAVYFLNGGAASIVTLLADGTMAEATTVGNEGMLGIEAFLGVDTVATSQPLMQVPDRDAERLSVKDFRREVGLSVTQTLMRSLRPDSGAAVYSVFTDVGARK